MRSALSISAGLAVVSVVLTTLWISHGPRPQADQMKKAAATVPISQQPSRLDAKGQTIRTIATGPSPGLSVGNARPAQNGAAVDPTPFAGIQSDNSSTSEAADPRLSTDVKPPTRLADVAPISGSKTDATVNSTNEPSAPSGNVDLNSASVEQLNALGAGMIGKRIIEFRPYSTPEDLITRRVLKKLDYETIRPVITVQ